MAKGTLLQLIVLLTVSCQSIFASSEGPHWSHSEPTKWGGLCHIAERQHRQSPIDINSTISLHTEPFLFKNYGLINTTKKNNGHAFNILLHPETLVGQDLRPQVSGGGLPGTYVLDSFHFHWGSDGSRGSEHLLQGCAFAGEMHLVHYKKEYGSVAEALNHLDGLAVLGIWLTPSHVQTHYSHLDLHLAVSKADYYFSPGSIPMEGDCGYTHKEHDHASHRWFDSITPRDNAESDQDLTPIHLRQIMPFDTNNFYRYEGSLTTPPCTENVLWTVFEEAVAVPESFLNGLRQLMVPDAPNHSISDNYRPPLSLSGRTVFHSGDASKHHPTCEQIRDRHATCTSFPDLHYVSIGANALDIPEEETQKRQGENCPVGDLPSPINLYLHEAEPVYSPNLRWKRISHCKGAELVNDGYLLKLLYPTAAPEYELIGNNLTAGFYLAGIQFRWGSDHRLGGLNFPVEMQLVHYNSLYKNFQEALGKSDGIVVVSKFFQEPASVESQFEFNEENGVKEEEGYNKDLTGIISAVQSIVQNRHTSTRIKSPNIRNLMGDTSTYYEYRGDLAPPNPTTCTSVTATWMVIRKIGHVSNQQLNSLKNMKRADGMSIKSNARPIQPTNDRQILLRINSPALTHEFKTMMGRSKRSPDAIIVTKKEIPRTYEQTHNSSPCLSIENTVLSLSLFALYLIFKILSN